MDIAFCTADNQSYDISSFSKLEPKLLGKLRRSLLCKKCDGKGYYRKKSRDGKPACFGAYHEDNCKYKTKNSNPKLEPEIVEEVNSIITNNDTIDVNFQTYTASQVDDTGNTTSTTSRPSSSISSQQHTKQPQKIRNASKGLRSLLRMLMHTDSFASSDIAIDIGWKFPYKAKNLFVNFDDINEELVDKKKGFWGIISNSDESINWLNTANEQDVSIPVESVKDYLVDVFKISDAEDLAGAAVLIFGWLRVSKSDSKKWYIKIHNDDPSQIFIKLKK